jgi:DNA polymerase-3 subunit beta
MEFKIEQSVLKEELSYIQGVVDRKATIPVLSNILIESIGEKEIRIVGTDLDCTIRCDAEADIIEPGAVCLPARKIFDIARAMDSGTLHFKREDNDWVTLKAGRGSYKLAGVSKEQYPEIPQFKSTPMKLSAEIFAYFVRNTQFAITNEVTRFTLSGAKFMVGDGAARMVTTDGHRLAFVEKQMETGDWSMDTLVPRKALQELLKLTRGADEIAFGEDTNHIYFETEGRLLITRKLNGTFPNYEMVMPRDNDKAVTFDLADMRASVYRVSLVADDRNHAMRMKVRNGEVEVSARSAEEGEGVEVVQAEYSGDEVEIGFNCKYLLELLNNVGSLEMIAAEAQEDDEAVKETDGDKVRVRETAPPMKLTLEFKDSNAQTQLRIAGETNFDYRYVVMPLRI